MALAPDYAMRKLGREPREQVRRHVSLCPHCGPLFQKMRIVVQEGRLVARASHSRALVSKQDDLRERGGQHSVSLLL